MDLNYLYSQHQLCLMRAGEATSRLTRTRHFAAAGLFANRIRDFQLTNGAPAAATWVRSMDFTDGPVGSRPFAAMLRVSQS